MIDEYDLGLRAGSANVTEKSQQPVIVPGNTQKHRIHLLSARHLMGLIHIIRFKHLHAPSGELLSQMSPEARVGINNQYFHCL